MSSESKKKRGESGVSNARNIPFRGHGFPKGYSLSTNIGNANHPRMGGSRFLQAMILGALLPSGRQPSERMYRAADLNIDYIEGKCGEGRRPKGYDPLTISFA